MAQQSLIPDGPVYHCGSLSYTRRHLVVLFCWLLWGDVCFVLMEQVVPSLMPLKFKSLEASNSMIGVIMVTVPMAMNFFLNPVISFKSDRYRSRWGRRIPFILVTMPFLTLSLLGMAYGDRLAAAFQRWMAAHGGECSPQTVALLIVGGMMVAFSFFNTFVNAVFWYLFNDVVPESLLARFMSWFRMVSLLTVSLYSLFIFPLAGKHLSEILCGAAVLYLLGFGLMCLMVREGEYPPPPENVDGGRGFLSGFKTFGRECHSFWHYAYLFMGSACTASAGAILIFNLFYYQGTGMNLVQIGRISSVLGISTALWILLSGWLADRFHPIRVAMGGQLFQLLIVFPSMSLWLFWHPAADTAFWVWLAFALFLIAPGRAFVEIADPPLLMRIFPRGRYGQFCAANSMWRSLAAIVSGSLAGLFLDYAKNHIGIANPYALIPLWQMFFTLLLFLCTWKLYRSWQSLGGDQAYQPPIHRSESSRG